VVAVELLAPLLHPAKETAAMDAHSNTLKNLFFIL